MLHSVPQQPPMQQQLSLHLPPGIQQSPQQHNIDSFNMLNGPALSQSSYGIGSESISAVVAPSQAMPPLPGSMQARYPPMPAAQGNVPPSSPTSTTPGINRMPPVNQMPSTMQPQQPRRLDPDHMPSPIQVIEDDKKNRGDIFLTNSKGQIPPLVTTNFITQDQGNCNPRFVRSTIYSVPANPDMMKQTSVPFGIVISPFAKLHPQEYPPPVSNAGEQGPVRCVRCKAYMCPFMQFMDGGRRFQCGFCKGTTEVPPDYFAHLDHTGQRVDKYERPELCLGSYEFVATRDYCRNNSFPNSPAFIFLIDVSYSSVKNGMVHLLCQNMKQILSLLPKEGDKSMKVGFITYSNTVHFYNIKNCLAQPQMMVVSDINDVFMPLLDGFLVDVAESDGLIDSLMEQILQMFSDSRETETILGPAIQAGLEALKASDCSGKLFVFHSTLPIAEAPGKLRSRDDRKLLGTDKEKTILAPQSNFYNNLGTECVAAGCCVDLFTFPNNYIDLATIGQVSRLTGGQVHKYTYFQADIDGHRFLEDLKRSVQHEIAFDAIMRVRTSTGVRPTNFYGCFYMSNTTDVELASIDSEKAITVEIKHDDKLTEEDAVYIQVAVLFTSVGGQRRLRIHNLSLNVCIQMADLYRNCELDTIMNYLAKSGLRLLMEQNPKAVKETIITRCAQILACYRKNCASPSLVGQLILPECMKLLPIYANSLLKSDAISGGSELLTDDRSFMMISLSSMDVASTVVYIYPRLIPLHDVDVTSDIMPVSVRCSMEKLQDHGVYLLENGIYMFIWIGMNVSSEWVQNVFSVQSAAQIDIDKTKLHDLDNPLSQRVRNIIQKVQEDRQRYMRLTIVRQRDKLEMVFRHFLVEDKAADNSPSYVDFLCHLHKEIRNLLS
uniref:Protein transport protein Sec24C n=1 Tax=Hemiscolopendra marginata TaxID=943146 RepID=A0A646QIX8_9MYRI